MYCLRLFTSTADRSFAALYNTRAKRATSYGTVKHTAWPLVISMYLVRGMSMSISSICINAHKLLRR